MTGQGQRHLLLCCAGFGLAGAVVRPLWTCELDWYLGGRLLHKSMLTRTITWVLISLICLYVKLETLGVSAVFDRSSLESSIVTKRISQDPSQKWQVIL